MSIDAVRVAVIGGEGAVMRRDEVVVVLGPPVGRDLIDLVDAALESNTGAGRVRAVARLLLDHHAEVGGAVVALADVVEVFALGPFEVVVGDDRVTAGQHILGLSEQVPLGELVAVVPAGVEVPEVPAWADLVGGATGGTGVVFVTAASESPPDFDPEPPPPPSAPVVAPSPASGPSGRFELVSLTAPIDLSDRRPAPIGDAADLAQDDAPAAEVPPYMRPVEVRGVLSPRGFFNHPEAAYCSRTGVKMGASHTIELVVGERPPLGVFTFDDGSTCAVQWNMVIGRDPRGDEQVATGAAAAYPLSDAELKVSRRHLLVELVDWDVYVQDLDTANGTWVREGPTDAGRRLAAGEHYRLQTGTEIRLGDRTFVYHEHHVR